MNRDLLRDSGRRFEAVLFDLDGTLLDTIADIAGTMNRVLAARGLPTYDAAHYKYFVGAGIEEMVKRALHPTAIGDAEVDEIVLEYRREYKSHWGDTSKPYAGVAEMLRGVESRGLRMAILSNKSHPFTTLMTASLLKEFRFDAVRGSMPEVPNKPDPAAALLIARELGVDPSRCLFLGDADIDMKTAVAAGMCPAGALWGFRTAEELRASGAAVLLASPSDLLELLD
jgi:phosphoglycolate phosphatase